MCCVVCLAPVNVKLVALHGISDGHKWELLQQYSQSLSITLLSLLKCKWIPCSSVCLSGTHQHQLHEIRVSDPDLQAIFASAGWWKHLLGKHWLPSTDHPNSLQNPSSLWWHLWNCWTGKIVDNSLFFFLTNIGNIFFCHYIDMSVKILIHLGCISQKPFIVDKWVGTYLNLEDV